MSVWGDAYSYNTTGSDGNTILIPRWILQTAREKAGEDREPDYAAALVASLEDPETAALIRTDVAHEMTRRGDAENILKWGIHLTQVTTTYCGWPLAAPGKACR